MGGGAAPVTEDLCRHLVTMGHEVDVVTMRSKGLAGFETVEGVNVYRTWAIRRRPDICYTHEMATYLPGAIFKTLQLAAKRRYDVVHCHFIIPGGPLAWLVSRLSKIPLVITCHGSDVPGYNPDRFMLAHKLLMPAWRFLAGHNEKLISPSESLRQLILRNLPAADVEVIPNGIYASQFRQAVKGKSIVLCSRLLPRKGFQHVIRAVRDMELDWQVNVIGDGPYRSELELLAAGSKTPIKFWGWLDQRDQRFRRLYETGAIFVFPSEAENFPTVLLEAMSASMAIITSTAGGCPEVVGDAGILVAPGDVEAIRSAIVELIESRQKRERLAADALKRVKQFGWSIVARRYVGCYNNAIETYKNK